MEQVGWLRVKSRVDKVIIQLCFSIARVDTVRRVRRAPLIFVKIIRTGVRGKWINNCKARS
jgi:hypothetical protein